MNIIVQFNQDFYNFIDGIGNDLVEVGFEKSGEDLRSILHSIAWTTSSELLGEIKLILLQIQDEHGERLPPCLKQDIVLGIKTISEARSGAK